MTNLNNSTTENELSQTPTEDFDFILSNTTETTDINTTIVTTTENVWNERLQSAISNYDPSNKIYSTYLNRL